MNKLTKIGKVSVINDELTCKKEKDLYELHNYMISRDFNNYIPIIKREDNKNYYNYIKNYSLNKNQLAQDIIKVVALMHNKTSYNKEVTEETYKSIYDNIIGYINYVDDYYYKILRQIEYVDFPSPSELLFMSNYSKIKEAIYFCKKELERWYSLVETKKNQRVCLNHGNLRLDHAILNEKLYLISWDKYIFDSPIKDIIEFYNNEWNNVDFSSILEIYFDKCKLNEDEKKLLFINISIPKQIEFSEDEYDNVVIIRNFFDYLYKTETLIGPYYSKEKKEE